MQKIVNIIWIIFLVVLLVYLTINFVLLIVNRVQLNKLRKEKEFLEMLMLIDKGIDIQIERVEKKKGVKKEVAKNERDTKNKTTKKD